MSKRTDTDWMPTFTGKQYWPLRPRVEDVDIRDIAHGLSQQCRYAGQTNTFYSTAEHSVHVSNMVPPALALEGLLHDAAEAYCSDLVRSVKKGCPTYKKIELRNDAVIRQKFGLPKKEHRLIKIADTDILVAEFEAFFPPCAYEGAQWDWEAKEVCTQRLFGFTTLQAERLFLDRFEELTGGNTRYTVYHGMDIGG